MIAAACSRHEKSGNLVEDLEKITNNLCRKASRLANKCPNKQTWKKLPAEPPAKNTLKIKFPFASL
jgi:hypothetical protein